MDAVKGIYMLRIAQYYYIGSSKNVKSRVSQHLNALKRNKHCNVFMQNAYNKYGNNSFSSKVIQLVASSIKLKKVEQRYLNKYIENDRCMNIARFASGGDTISNHPRNKEIRKRLREKRLGDKNPFYGRRKTEEEKAHVSSVLKGRPSPRKGYKYSEAEKIAARENLGVRFGKRVLAENVEYVSIKEVARFFGVSGSCVKKRCKSPNYPTWRFL